LARRRVTWPPNDGVTDGHLCHVHLQATNERGDGAAVLAFVWLYQMITRKQTPKKYIKLGNVGLLNPKISP
jgi:hypothetical protein